MAIIRDVPFQNKTIRFEFQKYAKQANGSVLVSSGETQVLVTVCGNKHQNPDTDFFPLGVDYIEKAYASGRIPGGYQKREGRPTDLATLQARVIDRPLRPCFPKDFFHEVVITATVLSYEHGHSPAPLALIGASTALMISDIPFNGPVAALRVGLKDGEYIIDPLEGMESQLDLSIACKPDGVLMVEAGAQFLSEDAMLEAIEFAHKAMEPIFEFQKDIQKEIGKPKWTLAPSPYSDKELLAAIEHGGKESLIQAFGIKEKQNRMDALDQVTRDLQNQFAHMGKHKVVNGIIEHIKSQIMRQMILDEGRRIDGRGLKEIRPIQCEIGVLKRPHGSSLFTRGETQSLASVTLASAEDVQRTETLWDTDLKERFMLHYNFPPFSVGEARMQRSPGRREIGHGALAYRALVPVMPSAQEFSYTIRVVAETLESNGSSSMAAVCAGTMGMLDAGIPLKAPVAGIAMGLIKSQDQYAVLSDILGDEDHLGDMDFKVCGSREGITALQMDIKISGLTHGILKEALLQAKEGREFILDKINEAIAGPADLSGSAPRMFKLKVKPEKIRDVIGPGGKNIKKITSEAGVKIDIEDSGVISIMAPDGVSAQAAKAMIRSFVTYPEVGDIYLGRATKVTEFGVFVELRPGLEGLCHISQWDESRVETLDSLVQMGDEVLVKVVDMDRQGRIKVSRRDAFGHKPTYT
jgi:polyribonucleotide nucleotidyltransferase